MTPNDSFLWRVYSPFDIQGSDDIIAENHLIEKKIPVREIETRLNEYDALLAVTRALHTGNYSQDDPELREALAALPERLR